MKKRTLWAALFLFAALAFASSARAQIIDIDATVPGLKTNISATTSVEGDSDGAAVGADAAVQATTGNDADDDEDESFVIIRSDITDGDTAVYDPADITTSVELSAYARSIMSADENIVKIEYGEDEVSIWYREPAELLGFIPITVTTKATVSADGEIEIDRPWYDIFVETEEDSSLEDILSSTAGTIARAEGTAELSSNAQARLLNALRAGMKMRYDSTATATTTDRSNDEGSY